MPALAVNGLTKVYAGRTLALRDLTLEVPAGCFLGMLGPNGSGLGDRLRQDEGSYLAFILPGLLVTTVAGQAFSNSSTSLFQAKNEGYIEDVLTSAMRPWQLALAYMAGGLVRGWLAAGVVAALAAPFVEGFDDPLLIAAILLLTG